MASSVTVTGPLLDAGRWEGSTDTIVGAGRLAPEHPATTRSTSAGARSFTGTPLAHPRRRWPRRDWPRGDRCSSWTTRLAPPGKARPLRAAARPVPPRTAPTRVRPRSGWRRRCSTDGGFRRGALLLPVPQGGTGRRRGPPSGGPPRWGRRAARSSGPPGRRPASPSTVRGDRPPAPPPAGAAGGDTRG